MNDDQFTEMAKADFAVKMWCGVIFGTLAIIGGIVGIIVSCVKKTPEAAPIFGLIGLVGLLVAGIDGYILFSRRKK